MSGLLATQQLTLGYHDGPDVIVNAELTLEPHDKMALLGANGSGKSTLMRALAGALKPRSGHVVVEGKRLKRNRAALMEHRRRVQLVLQDPDDQLFSADVFQDVSFGPSNMGLDPDTVRDRVTEALELLGVAHLGERATHHLSHGERKRVATAGAVAMRPDVLILDEPTAGLDPVGVDQMVAALQRLHDHGTTLLVATHDVETALAWAETAAVVIDGAVEQGTIDAVLSDGDVIKRAALRTPAPIRVAQTLGLPGVPRDTEALIDLINRWERPGRVGHHDDTDA